MQGRKGKVQNSAGNVKRSVVKKMKKNSGTGSTAAKTTTKKKRS